MTTPAEAVEAFLDALARHDVDAAMAVTDERVTVTVHPFGIYEKGADVLRSVLADLVRAFPDLMISVSRVIATGDVVTALFKAEGTQAAAYAGAESAAAVVTEFFDRYRAHDVDGMTELCSVNAGFSYVPVELWGKQRVLRGDGKVGTVGKPLWTGLFDLRGLAFPAWTLAAFAIGALAGMLIRRVVPAIVATLALYAGLVFAAGRYLRPHYLAPLVTRNPNVPGSAWILGQWSTKDGRFAFSGFPPATFWISSALLFRRGKAVPRRKHSPGAWPSTATRSGPATSRPAGSGPSSGSRAAGCSRCQRCSSPRPSGWSAAAPPDAPAISSQALARAGRSADRVPRRGQRALPRGVVAARRVVEEVEVDDEALDVAAEVGALGGVERVAAAAVAARARRCRRAAGRTGRRRTGCSHHTSSVASNGGGSRTRPTRRIGVGRRRSARQCAVPRRPASSGSSKRTAGS